MVISFFIRGDTVRRTAINDARKSARRNIYSEGVRIARCCKGVSFGDYKSEIMRDGCIRKKEEREKSKSKIAHLFHKI